MPKLDGSEVPPEVLSQPRVVPSPVETKGERVWPLLGSTPSRPKDFTPQPLIDAAKAEMANDRNDAGVLQDINQPAASTQPVEP